MNPTRDDTASDPDAPPAESPVQVIASVIERGLGGLFDGPLLRSILDSIRPSHEATP